MAYRKIVVNGEEHKYVIGKTHTKIVGVGVFPNDEVGGKRKVERYCDCCGEPLSSLYPDDPPWEPLQVTPDDIKKAILIYR